MGPLTIRGTVVNGTRTETQALNAEKQVVTTAQSTRAVAFGDQAAGALQLYNLTDDQAAQLPLGSAIDITLAPAAPATAYT